MRSLPCHLLIRCVLAGAVCLLTVSCTLSPSFGVWEDSLRWEDPRLSADWDRPPVAEPEAAFSYWADNGSQETLRVEIDLSEQAAYIYRADNLIGRSRVATGRAGHSTPAGSYTILEKQRDKRSNLYGRIVDANGRIVVSDADARTDRVPRGGRFVGAAMPYWMRLTSYGIGMHAGPIPNPGSPASHGCIRMPSDMARQLFLNAPVGTPVTIVP